MGISNYICAAEELNYGEPYMNILFLTLGKLEGFDSHTIYCDLLREFIKNGHSVYTLSPGNKKQEMPEYDGIECSLAYIDLDTVRGGNNLIKKGFSTIRTGKAFIKGIKRYYSNIRFDLVIYTTPPITFVSAIEFIKKRDGAKTYLLLKDIFPQNAVDLGMMATSGPKGLLYNYFRKKEKKLYAISDIIGCMSPANVQYVLNHNPEVDPNKVEVCPNSIEVIDKSIDAETRVAIRNKYGIPVDKKVFVYGGNLGKPQGIPFLIECLKTQRNEDICFLIVGDGTEYSKLEVFINSYRPLNVKLLNRLPKEDYDILVAACDVGMIFLDNRFTIPNFPSRILSYMQAKIPVLAVTDESTDIGDIIQAGKFGWWCPSTNVSCFINTISDILSLSNDAFYAFKHNSFEYLKSNYDVEDNYKRIIETL